jgi:hypothetical protein
MEKTAPSPSRVVGSITGEKTAPSPSTVVTGGSARTGTSTVIAGSILEEKTGPSTVVGSILVGTAGPGANRVKWLEHAIKSQIAQWVQVISNV